MINYLRNFKNFYSKKQIVQIRVFFLLSISKYGNKLSKKTISFFIFFCKKLKIALVPKIKPHIPINLKIDKFLFDLIYFFDQFG